ncbi:Cro/Cl family transcriptional regulator [Pseudomonas sp. HLS-6]|uniref:XRE family transcriptional regulator n=1 Tax=Pseudomonas sp. HLS-6 TaxID=2049589 RepID=UPI000C177705|nr:S24 family peptidase [Pseudomonas sp. HLS-6]ATR83038.1 Cro/Cl family transcriptional regulator [Pseudomonas sp. HLS-6]
MKITDRITKLVLARKPTIGVRSVKRDIATTCGISYEAVRQWFAGDTENIKNENLVAIADGYDTTVDWLLSGKDEPPRKRDLGPTGISRQSAPTSSADLVQRMLEKHGKGLSDEARRKIIQAVEADPSGSGDSSNLLAVNTATEGDISIPQYDVRAAMGHGQLPPEYNEVIRNVVIREELLRDKGVSYTSPQALAIITGWGQSMEGTINDKDPVIVDRGVNDYAGEGVYVLSWHGDLLIKRLQRKDEDHVWLISDNPKNKDLEARIDDVTIHAKVLLVWNARKV